MNLRDLIPNLIWDFIEKSLPVAHYDEVRAVIGEDLIDQTLEIRDELISFAELTSSDFCRQNLLKFSLSNTSLKFSENDARQFVKLYVDETSHKSVLFLKSLGNKDNRSQNSGSLQNAEFAKSLEKIRNELRSEISTLKKYLQHLQNALLSNFTPSDGHGDEVHTMKSTSLTLSESDSSSAHTSSLFIKRKTLSSMKRDISLGADTTSKQISKLRVNSESSLSSSSKLSTKSSASPSPRALEQNENASADVKLFIPVVQIKKNELAKPSTSKKGLDSSLSVTRLPTSSSKQCIQNNHAKEPAYLKLNDSRNSSTDSLNLPPLTTTTTSNSCQTYQIMKNHSKTNQTITNNNHNINSVQNRNHKQNNLNYNCRTNFNRNDTDNHQNFINELNPVSDSNYPQSERYNSAQRFRQMVLNARQTSGNFMKTG